MTPHNEAKKEDIAKTVLMPGDPLRAKKIAETYLENYRLVNTVRNIFAYTGTYKGKQVTVMASGMGMPSIGIYSYELFKFYDVESIIRIGSCGAYTDKLDLYDLILVNASYSTSSYALSQNGCTDKILYPSKQLNSKIEETANKLNLKLNIGTIYSSDVFYSEIADINELYNKYNCLGVEMESFALFHNANVLSKNAACILTVSDNLITKKETTALERQNAFDKMMLLALETIL